MVTSSSCIKLQSLIISGSSSKIQAASLPQPHLLPTLTICQSSLTLLSNCSNLAPSNSNSKKNPMHLSKAASSDELEEESKFVLLNADDPIYGPPALLLLGFQVEEASKVKQFLKDLDGDFLEVIYCTEDMIDRSLWDAMNRKQQIVEDLKIAKPVPRICFFSGLTGEEMMMFIDAFPETEFRNQKKINQTFTIVGSCMRTNAKVDVDRIAFDGLEPVVFAALVPNSADKPLRELIEEIMGDYEMTSKQSSQVE